MTSYNECIYWNTHVESYGTAVRIKKGILRLVYVLVCLATPFTNLSIPFILPKIKDITVRW